MNIEINGRITFQSESKEYSGVVINKFIQHTELELDDRTEMISATAVRPVFLFETADESHRIMNLVQIEKAI